MLNQNQHDLNLAIKKDLQTGAREIFRTQRNVLVAASAKNTDEAQENLRKKLDATVARFMKKRVRLLASGLELDQKEAEIRFQDTIQVRSAEAAKLGVDQITEAQTAAVVAGRKGATVPPVLTRALVNVSNGGTAHVSDKGLTLTGRPSDVGNDSITTEMLTESGNGDVVTRYTWVRGNPENPFEPHVDLEGTTWIAGENEREVLGESFLTPGAQWHPGDHVGCQCSYEITFERV